MASDVISGKVDFLVETLGRRLDAAIAAAAGRRVAIALTGGSLATTFLPALAARRTDWSHVDFYWGDERAVPADHPDSNFGAARAWLGAAAAHPMPGSSADLAAAAAEYEAELVGALGDPPVLDAALLGMGPDGHVCSLFPGHPLLAEERRYVAAIDDAPKPPPRRLTLTLPTLAAARLVVLAVTGAAKATAVRDAIEEPACATPAALVARRARSVLWLVDEAAASLLAQR